MQDFQAPPAQVGELGGQNLALCGQVVEAARVDSAERASGLPNDVRLMTAFRCRAVLVGAEFGLEGALELYGWKSTVFEGEDLGTRGGAGACGGSEDGGVPIRR